MIAVLISFFGSLSGIVAPPEAGPQFRRGSLMSEAAATGRRPEKEAGGRPEAGCRRLRKKKEPKFINSMPRTGTCPVPGTLRYVKVR